MPAISLAAYRRCLDRLAERIRTESDEGKRSKLLSDFSLLCSDSRKLRADNELKSRGIHFDGSTEA